jgi:hypothetical protein
MLAVLPGNPYDSRLYSLERAIFTASFNAALKESCGFHVNAALRFVHDRSFEIAVQDPNPQKASLAVRQVLAAFIKEIEKRRSVDTTYGTARAEPVELAANGARALIRMDGPKWGARERQKTQAQLATLEVALANPDTIRRVTRQISGGIDAEAIAEQIRRSLVIAGVSDSRLAISFVAPDASYMRSLLDAIPRKEAEWPRRLSLLDFDFVPAPMRTNWYVFNCCEQWLGVLSQASSANP